MSNNNDKIICPNCNKEIKSGLEIVEGANYCSNCNKCSKSKNTNQLIEEEDAKRRKKRVREKEILENHREHMRKRFRSTDQWLGGIQENFFDPPTIDRIGNDAVDTKYPSPKLDSENNITSNSYYSPTEKEKKSSFLVQNVYEERIHIQPKRLKELFQTILKNKSHNSIRKLGYEIGISQDKHLNGKGSSMSLESFNKLKNLLDFDLKITKDYTIKNPVVSTIVLEKSKELANLIGILLGDANVSKKRSKIRIYLNRYEDIEMVNHTKKKIKNFFNYNTSDDFNFKVVVLTI